MSLRLAGFVIVGGACWALLGCATPKATVVAEPAAPAAKPPEPTATIEAPPPDAEMRVGDLLRLPEDRELRPASPGGATDKPGSSAVIVNPPAKPAPKPTPAE